MATILADDSPMSDDKSRPQPLTEAYRKAHKSYVLSSGHLAAWELIGITLETKEKWGIELKSPTAVPLILFTLVIYSGYKMTVEWLQCDPVSRRHPAARVDFRIAHMIALMAIAISLAQYLWRIQIVEIANRWFLKTAPDIFFVASLSMLGLALAKVRSFRFELRSFLPARKVVMRVFKGMAIFELVFLSTSGLFGAFFYGRQVWERGIPHFAVSSVTSLCALLVAEEWYSAKQKTL